MAEQVVPGKELKGHCEQEPESPDPDRFTTSRGPDPTNGQPGDNQNSNTEKDRTDHVACVFADRWSDQCASEHPVGDGQHDQQQPDCEGPQEHFGADRSGSRQLHPEHAAEIALFEPGGLIVRIQLMQSHLDRGVDGVAVALQAEPLGADRFDVADLA